MKFSKMVKKIVSTSISLFLLFIIIPLIMVEKADAANNYRPQGCSDSVWSGPGMVHVSGWSFDKDSTSKTVELHIYAGKNSNEILLGKIYANKERTDVNAAYPGVGNYHGFDENIEVSIVGSYYIFVFAIDNEDPNKNTLLSKTAVNIESKYTISYNANGGSGAPSSQTKIFGRDITLSSTIPTRSGYTFQGWATSSSGSVQYAAGAKYTQNASATLYAIWKARTYTISYNANGGTGAPSSQTKTYGTDLTLSSTKPTRTGYTFQGWATSSSGSVQYAAGARYTPNSAATLYAVWKANTYTISYNANGGTGAPSSQTKTYGTDLILSSTKPTRSGYIFQGWSTSSSGAVQYAAGARYTSNSATTLYAIWAVNATVAESVSINKTNVTLEIGKSIKLVASVYPSSVSQSVSWSSNNSSIVKVSTNGEITALGYGQATITATTDNGKSARVTVNTLFKDVVGSSDKNSSDYLYYYEPVYWAAKAGITKGYSTGLFGVGEECTRASFMIFLWRMSGAPAPKYSADKYFNDVKKYASTSDTNKAIAWAYEKGITKGYSDGSFGVSKPITRADVLIILYRQAGRPSVFGTMKFSDCKTYTKGTDTYNAIIWGANKKITSGYSDGNFKPKTNCLREQIITFLFRYNNAQEISGDKIYSSFLKSYKYCIKNKISTGYWDPYAYLYYDVSVNSLSYAIADINGDGIDELFIYYGDSIVDIFTYSSDKVVGILSGGRRTVIILLDNGKISEDCYTGVWNGTYIYCIKNSKASLYEYFDRFSTSDNVEYMWLKPSSIVNGKYDASKLVAISESAYLKKCKEYSNEVTLRNITSFSKIPN